MFDEKVVIEFFKSIKERIEKEKIIERELKVEKMKNKAISIIGPRRAGKSYFLLKLFSKERRSIYFDMENIAFRNATPQEILKIVRTYENYFNEKVENIFLDEVQVINGWESLVRSLLDMGFYVFVSGSSSKLLSKEIATQLRGRSLSYILLPLSFREFLNFKGMEIKQTISLNEEIKIKRFLEEFLEWGGYPEVVLFPEKKERLLKEYHDLIFYRDFVERFGIKSLSVASLIFEFILQNFSKEISIRKIMNYVASRLRSKTKSTIYNYFDKISDIFFCFCVEKFRKSLYERKSWPNKIYICDLGLANLVRFEKDFGKRMENITYLELFRSTNYKPLRKIYYLKINDSEVDFVLKEGLKITQLIQVTYASSKDEIEKREIKALIKASELLKCENLLIITWDYEDELKIENKSIKCIPLWKWLLGNTLSL
ncbi:MAG: ATP-binding protein [Candidatus Aenigmatarchaeota archaeon]